MNIFLIGMSGSGKSALGRALAKKQNMDFMDTDFEIFKRFRKTPEAMIKSEGENALRQAELGILESIRNKDGLLVATGGGFPIFNDNISKLNQLGITIYLAYSPNLLWKRLQRSHKRPLINTKKDVEELLRERQKIYEKATVVYHGKYGFKSNFHGLNQIISTLSKNNKN